MTSKRLHAHQALAAQIKAREGHHASGFVSSCTVRCLHEPAWHTMQISGLNCLVRPRAQGMDSDMYTSAHTLQHMAKG